MMLPNTAAIPAVHADRLRAAEETGALAARLVGTDRTPRRRSSPRESVENALRVLLAVSGSTNAIIHLTAIAGRARHRHRSRRASTALSDETPVLVNLKPVGDGYMEDFHTAGGLEARAARHCRPAAPGRHRRHRPDASPSGWPSRCPTPIDTRYIRPRERARSSRRRADRPARQRSRPTARSSSAPPPRRHCSNTRAAPSSSPRSRTSPRASTIPISTSTADDILVLQNAGPQEPVGHAGSRLSADPQEARRARASRTWCASPMRA